MRRIFVFFRKAFSENKYHLSPEAIETCPCRRRLGDNEDYFLLLFFLAYHAHGHIARKNREKKWRDWENGRVDVFEGSHVRNNA